MKFRKTSLLGVAFILALVSCKKDDDLVASHAPEVTTGSVTNISDTTSTVYGDINSVGSSEISKHGHCWSTSSNPTINNNKTNLGNANAAGSYNSSVTGLSPNTTYYIRAYATNSYGTSYGNEVVFNTPNQPIAEFSVANTDINVGESIYFLVKILELSYNPH